MIRPLLLLLVLMGTSYGTVALVQSGLFMQIFEQREEDALRRQYDDPQMKAMRAEIQEQFN